MLRKKGWGKRWLAVSIPIVFLIVAAPYARADVSAGGQRLAEIQYDDGTWYFLVTGVTGGGPSRGLESITGETGLRLLTAFKETGNDAFLDAAVEADNQLLGALESAKKDAILNDTVEKLLLTKDLRLWLGGYVLRVISSRRGIGIEKDIILIPHRANFLKGSPREAERIANIGKETIKLLKQYVGVDPFRGSVIYSFPREGRVI